VVVALHRKGRNVREKIDTLPVEPGDVLLMMGTDQAIDALRGSDDLLLFDRARTPTKSPKERMILVLGVIALVVTVAAVGWLPIEVAAIAGFAVLVLSGILTSKEAYAAVEWNLIFLIFGMLGMGLALESTGAARWLAEGLVGGVGTFVAAEYQPIAALIAVYFTTMLFTEILSNNAIAALMAPIALRIGAQLEVNPQPFIIAVMFAASAAFSTPIGYQTNTYVYGVGGYRFGDFLRIGLPLNIMCFILAISLIPVLWPF